MIICNIIFVVLYYKVFTGIVDKGNILLLNFIFKSPVFFILKKNTFSDDSSLAD